MTDHEITALARELANDLYNDDKAYNSILWWGEEPKERKAEELKYALRFLLRRYYLADKTKVDKGYKTATDGKGRYKDRPYLDNQSKYDGDIRYAIYTSTAGTLQRLFPEIAKEVES